MPVRIEPDPTLQNNLMAFGRECNSGWNRLIDELIEELNKLPDEIEVLQIKEKFGCYDSETEVLTKCGWKYFRDVTQDDEIATLKDGEELEYQNPTGTFEYEYSGKMYKLETRGVNLLITPNHNLYVAEPDRLDGNNYRPYKRTPQPFLLETYEKFYLKNKKFKKNVMWIGKEIKHIVVPGYEYTNYMKLSNKNRTYRIEDQTFVMDSFLDFLGWYIAEGYSNKRGSISVACNNTDGGREKQTITRAIENLGYPIKTTLENKSALIFRIYNVALARWLIENCGHKAKNKKIPDFVKEVSPRQIEILLNSLYLGDGHTTKTYKILTTVSKTLSNDVQELILMCGDTFRETKYPPKINPLFVGSGINPTYAINWMKLKYHNTQEKGLAKSSFEGLINYSGKVYCVEVPNHIIYIRRGGKGVWCGNSLRFYVSGASEKAYNIISLYEGYSYHICEACGEFYTAKTRVSHGWWKTLCLKCAEELDWK
jgi:replicative DNA helicase Mcm